MNISIVAIVLAGMIVSVPVAFATHTDKVISEGANKIGSSIANDAGYTGKGVKIAVIDEGFDINNSEITGHVNISGSKSFISGACGADLTNCNDKDSMDHGTAVAEIIADIAPDAELYLYNFGQRPEFLNLVDHLIKRGDIDIISMSLGYEHDV